MGKIENQMGGLQGVASRFSVLLDDDSMNPTNAKSKGATRRSVNKAFGAKKKQSGIKVDLQEAASKASTKTKKTKPLKKRNDVQSQDELEKLKTMFSQTSLSTDTEDSDSDSFTDDLHSKGLNRNSKNDQNIKKVTFSPNKVVFNSSQGKDPRDHIMSIKSKPEKSIIRNKKGESLKKDVPHEDKALKSKTLESSSAIQNQFKTDLEKKDLEISNLKQTNEDLRTQLEKIKKRYKITRSLLDEAEMKEKAQLAKELIELREVKDEMSQNIIDLTKEVEQYKTKTQGLNKELRNKQGKQKSSIPG